MALPFDTATMSSRDDLSKRARKLYTITKCRESGTEPEHDKFFEAIQLYNLHSLCCCCCCFSSSSWFSLFCSIFFLFDLKFFRITFCVSVRNCVLVSGVIFDLRFPNWGMEAVRFVFEVMLEYFDWLFGLLSSGEEFWPVVWLFGVICRRNVPKHLNCCFVFVWTLIVCAFSLWFYASALIVTRRR